MTIEYNCYKCSKKFTRKSSLDNHLKRKTPCNIYKLFLCNSCDKYFSTQSNLTKHVKNNCKNINIKSQINNLMA